MARLDIVVPDHLVAEFRNAAAERQFDTLSAWGRDALICSLRSGNAVADLERRMGEVFGLLETKLTALESVQQAMFQLLEALMMTVLVRVESIRNPEELKTRISKAKADYRKIIEHNAEIAAMRFAGMSKQDGKE